LQDVRILMMQLTPKDLLGKEVFTADGRVMGGIRAISWKNSDGRDGKVWIDRGDGFFLACIQDLMFDGEKVILICARASWLNDDNPMYR
jgi:hypothetical protein